MSKVKKTFILDADDLTVTAPIEIVNMIKDHYPKFKMTLFMIPFDEALTDKKLTLDKYTEWGELMRKDYPFIELGVHGYKHVQNEANVKTVEEANELLDKSERLLTEAGVTFKKIFRAPFWQMSDQMVEALIARGYVVAHHPRHLLPQDSHLMPYTYNWSYDKPAPDLPLVKGHGHFGNTTGNGILESMQNLLSMPLDAEFMTIGELMEKVHGKDLTYV